MKCLFKGILIIFSCFLARSVFESDSQDYEKIADKITEKTAKKLKDEKGLVLVGIGGQMMNDIQKMMMGFNFYKVVDMDTARQLLVDSVEEYLSDINANNKIRPYLHNYPFTPQNVEIVIYFYNPDGSKVPNGKLKIAEASRDKIIYYVDCPEKHAIKVLHEETYQEAVEIIRLKSLEYTES